MKRIAPLAAFVLPLIASAQAPNGPDAPDMVVMYDPVATEFTFVLSNSPASNNYGEAYSEWTPDGTPDPYWRFQGYAIYQFRSPADADDSLHLVILDPLRALPVIIVDKADTIHTMLSNLHGAAPDTCIAFTYILDNSGLSGDYSNSFDPFTQLGYDTDETYCFVAVAMAYNRYHHSATCDTLQQVLLSDSAPTGALHARCIDLATVGVTEHRLENIALAPVPTASTFSVTGEAGMRYRVRCLSMMGALVLEHTIISGEAIDASGWAPGLYRVMITDVQGRSIGRTMVVEH